MVDMVPAEQLAGTLSSFKCTRDEDIQDFLQNRAVEYENRGWCSVYILADEEKLEQAKELFVDGYFTLSNKVIRLSDSVSGTKKRKLFSGLKKKDDYLHFILIGQLGKYVDEDNVESVYGATSATEILDKAFEIIYQVKERITCNCVLVECKNEPKVRKIYEDYGFRELQEDDGLIQYFKII